MKESDFIEQITHYQLKVRDVIIPTTSSILLYGHQEKTKIIIPAHHEHFYSLIKKMELTDERQEELKNLGQSDSQILSTVQVEYDSYLKEIRKQIIALQKSWSNSWTQQRAGFLIDYLKYRNIFHICDLVIQRNVPYELILELIFDVQSTYGQYRTQTPKADIYVDPRVQKVLEGKDLIPAR